VDGSYLALDPRPGLHIIDINHSYAHATMTTRTAAVDRPFFEVFPGNPDNPIADGVSNLYASLRAALDRRRPNTMLAKPLFSPLAGFSYDQFVRRSVTSST
jgi:hypothetical protein